MIVPVSNVGALGIVTDLPLNELPLNAWTAGRNVRFIDGAVEKFSGHIEVYATPSWAPYWLLPVPYNGTFFWLYAGLTKCGATDGATHADITRAAGGDYTTDLNIGWTGTQIEGMAVINNGSDVPQMWTPSLVNDLTALTGWNANHLARSMRSLKRYLVALDITKTGTRYPHMIKWSHQAPTNGVPTSWDEADETLDAGEYNLSSEGGFLVDSAPLRDDLIVYKENQTWLMQYLGGIDIFRFIRRFSEMGMFARKCALEFFNGKHLVFTGEDVVLHDGQQANSIIAKRLLSSITGTIDSTYYQRSYIAANFKKKEVWICFPQTGSSICNTALVWNWQENVWGVRDIPNASFITSGIVYPIDTGETWSGASSDWSTDPLAWGDRSYDPSKKKMLMAIPGSTKLFTPDDSQQFNGTNYTSYVEKTAIGFPLKKDNPPDYTTEKLLRGIWPRISGTAGGVVNIYVGTQDRVDGAVNWEAAFPFTIGTTEFVDCLLTSKLHALKFESIGNITWRLHGYDADVTPAGMHGT